MCDLCGNESQCTRVFTPVLYVGIDTSHTPPKTVLRTGPSNRYCLPCFRSVLKTYKSQTSHARGPTPGAAGGTTEALRSLKGETISN